MTLLTGNQPFVFLSDDRSGWEKDFYVILVCTIAMVSCGTLGPILIPGTVPLMEEFGLSYAELSQVILNLTLLTF